MNPPEVTNTPLDASPAADSSGAGEASVYSAISATVKKILQEKNLKQVLKVICEEACRILGADRSLVIQVRIDDLNQREILYANNMPKEYLEKLAASRAETMMADVFRNRKLKIFSDVGRDSKIFDPEDVRKIELRTLCAIPLVVGGEFYAALLLHHLKERDYSSDDLQIAEAFGDLASIAIEKSLLIAENEDRAARMEIVGRIAKIAGSSLEPDKIFQTVSEEICRIVPNDRFVIADFSRGENDFHHYFEKTDEPIGMPSREGVAGGLLTEEVYKTKKPVYVPDLLDSPWANRRHARHGYRSVLVIPIIQDDRCIAHMRLASKKSGRFTMEERELLVSIADHLAPVIRNANLYKISQERARRLEAAGEIARAVGSELKPEELFQTIAREIRRVVPCQRCVIATLGEESRFFWHIDSDIEVEPYQDEAVGIKSSWGKEVYEKKRAIRIPDIRELSTPRTRYLAEVGIRSVLVVPIIQNDKCIAHLTLASVEVDGFSAENEEFLVSISHHLGSAIRNAMLHQVAKDRASSFAVLNELSQKITKNLDLNEVLENIAHAEVHLLKGDLSRIFLLDELSELIVLKASCGDQSDPEARKDAFRLGEGVIGKMIQSGEEVLIGDVQEHPAWVNVRWARELDLHSYLGQPLRRGGGDHRWDRLPIEK